MLISQNDNNWILIGTSVTLFRRVFGLFRTYIKILYVGEIHRIRTNKELENEHTSKQPKTSLTRMCCLEGFPVFSGSVWKWGEAKVFSPREGGVVKGAARGDFKPTP